MTYHGFETSTSLSALLTLFIEGKEISKEDILLGLEDIQAETFLPKKIQELYLISIYCFLSEFKYAEKVHTLLDDIYNNQSALDESLPDQIALYKLHLSRSILGLKSSIKPRKSFSHIKHLSHLDEMALCGVVSFFCGLYGNDESFILEGQRIGELFLSLINDSGEVDAFFLIDKGVYKKDSLRASVFILISLYRELINSQKAQAVLPLLDPYQGGLFQSLDIEKRLLCRLLEGALVKCREKAKMSEGDSAVEGLLRLKGEGFSITTSQFNKIGIGSISYENTLVVPSFGPHVLPLGKSDLYGLKTPIALNGEIQEGHISSWARVASKDDYGHHWIHTKMQQAERSASLESFVWSAEKEEELALVFFVRCESLSAEGKVYMSGGLERASCTTQKLDLNFKGKEIQMLLKNPSDIEIIPLAGQEFFYNSDFIISVPFKGNSILAAQFVID